VARCAHVQLIETSLGTRLAFGGMTENGEERAPPRGWRWVKLGEIGEIAAGITLGRRLPAQEQTRKVPYLRVANVKDGFLDLAQVNQIEATDSEIERWRLLRGDLLLTEGGDPDKLGRGTVWRDEIPGCIHQNHIFRVRLDPERYAPEFIAAQLITKGAGR
jgi:type I restriction enzyme S subunit